MTTGLRMRSRVRVREAAPLAYYRGKVGRLTRNLTTEGRSTPYPYEVDFGDGLRVCFSAEELEVATRG